MIDPSMEQVLHYLRHASSFSATLMVCWFALYLLLWGIYPAVRKYLLGLHPATSSNVLLALLALPFLTSLVASALVFSPLLGKNLITLHYHSASCENHFPLLQSGVLIGGVLILVALVLFAILRKCFSQLLFSLKLESKLTILGDRKEHWYLLPNQEHMVFTIGWLKNTIFITDGLLRQCTSRDLDIILEHEKEHARRFDNLRLLAGRLLVLISPEFIARKFTADLQLFGEAACDFSTANKHGYLNVAEALLKIQRLSPRRFCHFNKAMVSAFTGSEVENRIIMLLEGGKLAKARKFRPLIYLALLGLLGVMLVDPLHHGIEWLFR